MARIVFSSDGTYGDLFPLIPIASELRSRGHEIKFAADATVLEILKSEGFPTIPVTTLLGFSVLSTERRWLQTATRRGDSHNRRIPSLEGAETAADFRDMCRMGRVLRACQDLQEASRGSDLMVCGLASFMGSWVAESLSLKRVIVSPQYRRAPGRDLVPGWPNIARRFISRMGWRFQQMLYRFYRDPVTLRPRRDLGLPLTGDWLSRILASCRYLLTISPTLFPISPLWGRQVAVVGHISWDRPGGANMPDDVARFLEEGEPPVLVSFGSASSIAAVPVFQEAIQGLLQAGVRGLVLTVHPAELRSPDPRVHVARYAPFSQVLPRCRAVVHHAGIGTLHEVLRAGLPSVAVPRLEDQPLNARILIRRGVARMIPWLQFDADRLARELGILLNDDGYRRRSEEIRDRMSGESGVPAAAEAIEEALHKHVCPPSGHRDPLLR